MNTILSLITCFAMLFSGTAALPAQPETAQVLTIDNITVWDGDEVVTLNPSVVLTSQIGTEESDFHFEVKDADGTARLPVSASFDADGISFELNGKSAYHIDAATIEEEMGDVDMESAIALLGSAAELYALAENSEATAELSRQVTEIFNGQFADRFTATQVEVNGETLDGSECDLDIYSADMFAFIDKLAEMDNAYGRYFKALLTFTNDVTGTSYASYAEMFTEEYGENEYDLPMHIVIAGNDSLGYSSANISFAEEGGLALDLNMVCTAVEGDTEMSLEMTAEYGDTTGDCTASVSLTDTVESFSLECNMNTAREYETIDENGQPTTYTYTNDASLIAGYSKVIVDDDTSTEEFTMTLDTVNDAGQEDETNWHYDLRGDRKTSPEDGGSLAEQTLSLTVGEESVGLSYNAHYSEADVQDYFDGKTIVDVNSDGAQELINADATALSADAIALTTDGSVLKLISLFSNMNLYGADYADDTEDYDYDDSYDYDDDYDLSSESDDSDYAMTQVSTLEEAAEIFAGTMPEYTAPEGYSIESIQADEETLCVRYAGENLPEFELITYAYTYESGEEICIYKDGALTAPDGQLVQTSSYDDGNVFSVTVTNAQGEAIYFYFYDDATADDVSTLLSGLN